MFKDIHIMVPAEIQLSEQELQAKAQESLLCSLYAEDLANEVQIMQMLNITRREFHDLLAKYHVAPLHTDEDLEDELHFARS